MRRYLHSGCTGIPAPPGWPIHTCHRTFAVSPSTVSRAYRRDQEMGHYTRRAGQGCRRATTQQQDRYLLLCARRNRRSTARALQNRQKLTVRGWHEGPTSSTGTCAHSPTPCSSIGICQRTPELAGSPLLPRSLHRWEQVHNWHVTESGDDVAKVMLPTTSSSMTGLAVGQ